MHGIGVALVMLQKADQIARPGKAGAHHARIAGAVDHVIDAAHLEAAIQRNTGIAHKMPFRPRDDCGLSAERSLTVITLSGLLGSSIA